MHERIFGIVPPMTTPFRPDDTIDEGALRAETRYLTETARVHGLAATGSTGEGHALSTDEVRRVTAVVTEEAEGRVPVITGITNVKHCQELQGRAAGVPRAPMPATSTAQAPRIREALHDAGLV